MDTPTQVHSKYRIAEMLRTKYGELNIKRGMDELKAHTMISRKQTIADWMQIEAGSDTHINRFVLPSVLSFFNLQKESQLLTPEHKKMIKGEIVPQVA